MIAPLAQDAIAALFAMRAAFPSQPLALIGATALGCHIPMKWRRTEAWISSWRSGPLAE